MTPSEPDETPRDEPSQLDVRDDEGEEVATVDDDDFRVIEPGEIQTEAGGEGEAGGGGEGDDDLVVVESPHEKRQREQREAKKKEEEEQPKPRINFWMLLLMFGVLFVMIDPGLRSGAAGVVGTIMEPLVGFNGRYPTMTIILTGLIMIFLTTVLRHFFIDWLRIAEVQNTMKAFQKEFNRARKEKDTKRVNELQKVQPKVMGLQAEMTGSQMKPMAFSMLIVVPLFAWLWEFITEFEYHFFSTPWNLHVNFFSREGIIFGTSILPHWILLYSVMSIPFGMILQKALKVYSWRNRLHHVFTGDPEVENSGE